jgi:hypothetical protein
MRSVSVRLFLIPYPVHHFGAKKAVARERYEQFVAAGMKLGHQAELYLTDEGRILGTEEFVDATIHRIGETRRSVRKEKPMKAMPAGVRPAIFAILNRCRSGIV